MMSVSLLTQSRRGAELVFRSLLVPVFGKFFGTAPGGTASGLRAKADSLHTE